LVIIYCLPFFILRLLITSFASFGYYVLSVLLYITASDYIFRIFWLLYIVCPSLYYGFWLHLSHLLVIIYCLSFFKLRLLITSFASSIFSNNNDLKISKCDLNHFQNHMSCLSFRSTWFHSQFLVRFVLLNH
jgi:hypothetical protein